jgi:hypothetical protein
MQNQTAGNPSTCDRFEAPPSPGGPSKQSTVQPHPLLQTLLEFLEQPAGTPQLDSQSLDVREFLVALHRAAFDSVLAENNVTGSVQLHSPPYPPLESVTRPTVETAAAAFYMNRRPQTLRIYACHETGPIRPMRVHGRLHWKTDDLRRLMGVK